MFGFSPFSESPISAVPLNHYSLTCNAGSYTLTGNSATLHLTKAIIGTAGSYAFTGNAANFLLNQVIDGNTGSYTFTGSNASFVLNQSLKADAGSYSFTGNSATFTYNQTIYAGAFSFIFTGSAATLIKSSVVSCNAGSYTFTGHSASFTKGKSLVAQSGNYVFTGKSAQLNYTPITVFVESKGGLPKEKRKTKADIEKEQREELEAIVKREFDILDGTYEPEVVEIAKETVLPKIKEIDYTEYQIALAQVNALLLQAKIAAADYQAELDDEEALLMLL